jgi:hypothetical protein
MAISLGNCLWTAVNLSRSVVSQSGWLAVDQTAYWREGGLDKAVGRGGETGIMIFKRPSEMLPSNALSKIIYCSEW